MADRRHVHHSRHQMASSVGTSAFPRSRSAATTNTFSGSTNVRRNLFQSQLTRRPTPTASVVSNSSASSSTDGLRFGLDGDASGVRGDTASASSDSHAGAPAEIIVRDRNGEVELMDPPSPTPDELNDAVLDERQENEQERQRLAEAIKYHQQRTSLPGQPEDLLEAIRASLRAKVSALAEDNWMYEPEDVPRLD
ncbi:hypothetical protein SPI_06163 [Niveomyces insectorum RCEF 264]|uniref:Uncharacterized protein n=1 Tax=Niveomyces insectorum RCEF 264 TaxID=1081102 RepID=A0A167RUX0_9HYPO|nr:hypothetical protein SPI_06163 [Niveomyces insectorum RCEF 264]